MSFIKTLFSGATKYVVIGMAVLIAILAGILYFVFSELQDANKELGMKDQQITQLQETAEHNAEMARRLGQQHTRELFAITNELKSTTERKDRVRVVTKEVTRVLPSDEDACNIVPPQLVRTLDGLRRLRSFEVSDPGGNPAD